MENEKTNHNLSTGQMGEGLAEEYMRGKGYEIIARNYRSSRVEIDLICKKDLTYVFVEVKTRYQAIVQPELAVNYSKQLHLARAAAGFLRRFGISDPIRFDIIAINIYKGKTEIIHFEDAFYPTFYK